MAKLHEAHPQYGFDQHKGYPTASHMAALHKHGPLPEHRYSFGPVAKAAAARGIVTDTYVDRRTAAAAAAAASGSGGGSKAAVKGAKGAKRPSAAVADDAAKKKRGRPAKVDAAPAASKAPRAAKKGGQEGAGKAGAAEAPSGRMTRSRAKGDAAH
eukprot:4071732-Prymnesium_polylepis.1